jgi:hypothetical protein
MLMIGLQGRCWMILTIFSWRTPGTFDFQLPAVYFPAMSGEICKSTFSRMNSGFGLELSGDCNSGFNISTMRQDLSMQNGPDGVNTPSGPDGIHSGSAQRACANPLYLAKNGAQANQFILLAPQGG